MKNYYFTIKKNFDSQNQKWIFDAITKQIKRNFKARFNTSKYGDTDTETFEIEAYEKPTNIVRNYCQKGYFKLVPKECKTIYNIDGFGKNIYIYKYKDLCLDNKLNNVSTNLGSFQDIRRYDKTIKRDIINDTFRYDDYECHSYSKDVLTEYDGAFCPDTAIYYPDSDCMFDLYLKMKGYKDVDAYLSYVEAGYLNNDIVMAEYREWLETAKAADYEIGEDVEELV